MAAEKTNNKLTLKVFTPKGMLFESEVESVYFQSSEGQIGILSHHVAYTGELGVGVLEYKVDAMSSTRSCVIYGGVCEVDHDVVSILTDEIYFADQLDLSALEQEKLELAEKARFKDTSFAELQLIQRKLARINACQQLVSH